MTLHEIKTAVEAGHTVCWANPGYQVRRYLFRDGTPQWLVTCTMNNSHVGLTRADNTTLSGKEEDFFIHEFAWTVLLSYPIDLTDGQVETYLAHVHAATVGDAIGIARSEEGALTAATVLLVTKGHITDMKP